jgi:hypothetical protein
MGIRYQRRSVVARLRVWIAAGGRRERRRAGRIGASLEVRHNLLSFRRRHPQLHHQHFEQFIEHRRRSEDFVTVEAVCNQLRANAAGCRGRDEHVGIENQAHSGEPRRI